MSIAAVPINAKAVRINSISSPQAFRSGEANSVILDCDFSITPDDELVVVKWFLNDEIQHIYQWIQSRDSRTYSPKIKPYVDETFVVSDHPTRYRALRLLNPPASLSGKYTCSVSSLANEDINSTHLVIYESPSKFEMAVIETDDETLDNIEDGFNISCTAIGVYPEPEIKLYRISSSNDEHSIESKLVTSEIKSNNTTVLSFRSLDGLYSITLNAHIEPTMVNQNDDDDDDNSSNVNDTSLVHDVDDAAAGNIVSPSRERLIWSTKNRNNRTRKASLANIADHYECRMAIPYSHFVEVKRLAVQDEKMLSF
ncbi:hypothetical protein RDWZM_009688 [Blomia tropicalis]|uniref:Ig-like domain-containing protein n=1 Tax=Blomia tropicalis TaxID=40697 RepID=A0A9Q0RMI6_BLOTA|nr:hypothetical protein RDWZM_009688 [Blomia tropicalis]